MQTARLDEIFRQKDPALKEVVEQLARGEVREAIQDLDRQGRVHEIADRDERLKIIPHEYAARPEGTLVVSPDNRSRQEIDQIIHSEMQARGHVERNEHGIKVLVPRQEMTCADLQWAGQYEAGDVVRYTKGSRVLGIEAGEYARVQHVDQKQNLITVERTNGEHRTYDPRRLHGSRSIGRPSAPSQKATACSSPHPTGNSSWPTASSEPSRRSRRAAG
jgi:hypothetical protein